MFMDFSNMEGHSPYRVRIYSQVLVWIYEFSLGMIVETENSNINVTIDKNPLIHQA